MSQVAPAPASAAPAPAVAESLATVVTTPTVRRVVRRSLYWGVAVAGLLGFGVLMVVLNGSGRELARWGADEAAPVGSRAVLEVLRAEGIDVTAVGTLQEARRALAGDGAATLAVGDPRLLLDAERWGELDGLAEHLVLLEPPLYGLDALGLDAIPGDPLEEPLDADCALPLADRTGAVDADGVGYTSEDGLACFTGDAGAALVQYDAADGVVSVLGAGGAVQNDQITQAGNAALALGLLGEHPRLVWYLPTPADLTSPSLDELTPGWVNPVAWLLLATGLAAAVWRGRRLGPVVVEQLPVTVKTTETMEGRARLYARDGARLRALDALRVGTLRRLAEGLALGRAAGVDDIVRAVAAITGRSTDALRRLLVDREPDGDRELVALSDQLLDLEREVLRRVALDDAPDAADSTRTQPPTGRMDS
ncbi:DUF4350 domain-containing protein [Microcella indica]|uniref:DUF4350 domain-containing protein n=1 Tax=Microcella indica TaxID=2750620 RepID=UPI0015CF6997|nr:DUF4350 domain-containing protein [Microcella indica]